MNNNTEIEVINLLVNLTVQNKIHWVNCKPSSYITQGNNSIITPYFKTTINESDIFAVYLEKFKKYIDEDIYYWDQIITLVKLNRSEEIIWTFKSTSAVDDLFTKVSYSIANIDDTYNRLKNL